VNRKSNGRPHTNWLIVQEVVALAKDIATSRPWDECPAQWRALLESARELTDSEKTKAVFSLVIPVLAGEARIESLFALARATEQKGIAYATAAIVKAMRVENIENLMRLEEFGLIEVKVGANGRSFLRPFIGSERLTTAASGMSAKGLHKGARVIREHLDRAATYKASTRVKRESARSLSSALSASATDN